MIELSNSRVLSRVLILGFAGFVFSVGTLIPVTGQAEISLRYYPTYLRTMTEDPVTKEITIYAARTRQNGVDCTVNNPSFTNNTSTCNSCAKISNQLLTNNTLPCNDQEIHPTLGFSITLSSTDAADYACAQPLVGRVAGEDTIFTTSQQTTVALGVPSQDVTATFTWAQLCNQAGSSNCESSFNKKFEFGFDRSCAQSSLTTGAPQFRIKFRFVAVSPTMTLGCGRGGGTQPGAYEGICDYVISPGDQKVFVKGVEGVTGNGFRVPDLEVNVTDSPDDSEMSYAFFRVYYRALSNNAPAGMTFGDSHKDLAIDGTKLNESRVTGLTNGVDYYFWGAMVDQAGTVTNFPASLTTAQSGRPEEVFGLLDEKGCFIATAAYGTDQAHEIQILRDFRDIFLARTEPGRAFIRWYYRNSPEWAAVIRDHEVLRGVVRGFLDPMIGMADLSIRYGGWVLYLGILGVFTVLGGGLFCARLRRKKSGTP